MTRLLISTAVIDSLVLDFLKKVCALILSACFFHTYYAEPLLLLDCRSLHDAPPPPRTGHPVTGLACRRLVSRRARFWLGVFLASAHVIRHNTIIAVSKTVASTTANSPLHSLSHDQVHEHIQIPHLNRVLVQHIHSSFQALPPSAQCHTAGSHNSPWEKTHFHDNQRGLR